MPRYKDHLPQPVGGIFLTDGGIETTLIFYDKLDLPYFAAFPLLQSRDGRETLRSYSQRCMQIATASGHGFILESPTWRANADWGDKLGYSETALAAANKDAMTS